MKFLFSSSHGPEAGMLKSVLDEAGIPCELRNENSYSNFPGAAFYPELWILSDDDYPKAVELRDAWRGTLTQTSEPWICPLCKEESEGQFARCWKCGAD